MVTQSNSTHTSNTTTPAIPESGFTFSISGIRNFGDETRLHTEFQAATALYGGYASGKSTIISGLLKFLRAFIDSGHSSAELVFLGNDRRNFENGAKNEGRFHNQPPDRTPPFHARHHGLSDGEHSVVSLWYFHWQYELTIDFSGKDKPEPIIVSEKLIQWPDPSVPPAKSKGSQTLLHRVGNSPTYLAMGKDHRMEGSQMWKSAARDFHTKFKSSKGQNPICLVVEALQGITVISDIDLHSIRYMGSRSDHTYHFHQRGHNCLTLAHGWLAERRFAGKMGWIRETMRSLYPERFYDVEFVRHGTQISCRFFATQEDAENQSYDGIHPKCASSGMLQTLVLLIGLASAQTGETVAIDDIGDKIDPETQLKLVDAMVRYAIDKEITFLFTTNNHAVASYAANMKTLDGSEGMFGVQALGLYKRGNSTMIGPLRPLKKKPAMVIEPEEAPVEVSSEGTTDDAA